ncbi:podocan-like isoform X2 [Antedon mediterranea]|uniref:podocan-like isoform X2 n=1 Tax=Antedon mediterranea TaxID=105859 RepID=UPI003AF89D3E
MLKMDSNTSFICFLLFLWVDLSIGVEIACSNDINVNAVCECIERTQTVNCANRGLNEWPVGIPLNTQILYMNNNNLKEIDEDAFSKLHELFTINVNNNLLSKLPSLPKTIGNIHADKNLLTDISTVFNDLPILHILSLTNNKITLLRNTTFKGSTVITDLNLSFNNINIIEPFTFANNSKLALLRIIYNKNLQMLGENAFAFANGGSVDMHISPSVVELSTGTFKLSTGSSIYLANNKLRSIPSKAFQGGDILVLKLVDNNISFIHNDAFVALDSIFMLLLAYNRLTEIPIFRGNIYGTLDVSWNSLTSLEDRKIPAVKNVFLSKNNIQTISTNIFANMSSLNMLFLVHNNIAFIEDGAFNGTNLYSLFLYGNNISNITYKTLETKDTTLEYIYLFDNPIKEIGENALSHMKENGTVYLNCCGLKSIPSNIGKFINIVCVTEGTEIEINGIEEELFRYIGREIGLTCNSTTSKCSPCKEGTYSLYDNTKCGKCPPGDFLKKLNNNCCRRESGRGVLLLQIDDDPDESQFEENNIII